MADSTPESPTDERDTLRPRSRSTGAGELLPAAGRVCRACKCERPGDPGEICRGSLPGLLHRVRRDARVGSQVGHGARQESAILKWWVGGRLNASVNCVDRHLESRGDKNALISVSEPEDAEIQGVTYRELHRRINEFAALLKDVGGAQTGDRVTFHLPMLRSSGLDARMRSHGRDPFAGVWRV